MIVADQSGSEKVAAKTIAGHLADFKRPHPAAWNEHRCIFLDRIAVNGSAPCSPFWLGRQR